MLRRFAVGVSFAVVFVAGTFGPTAAPVQAAEQCTGWTNEFIPPTEIRVLRTTGPSAGTVEVAPFRRYVEVVMAAEWSASTPREALRVGAIAAKQYAWYHAMHWRGKSAGGGCYDVVDSSRDQIYVPELDSPAQTHVEAVASTWSISLRKGGRFFSTGYRPGSHVACAEDSDGWHLFQHSAMSCARDGLLLEEILRRVYGGDLQIVRPGASDFTGDGLGDLAVLLPQTIAFEPNPNDPTAPVPAPLTTVSTRIYAGATTPGPALTLLAPTDPLVPATIPAERAIADVTGDGAADLLHVSTGPSGALQVMVATALPAGAGFAPSAAWWDGSVDPAIPLGSSARLVAGDFDGDGLADVALLVGTTVPQVDPSQPPVSAAEVFVLRSDGQHLGPAALAWGPWPIQLGGVTPLAADVNGDSRTDLVLQIDLGAQVPPADPSMPPDPTQPIPAGLSYVVVNSDPSGRLGVPVGWGDLPDLAGQPTWTLVADIDRDGRDDLVVIHPNGPLGVEMIGLVSSGLGFERRTLWSAAKGFRWTAAKFSAADTNGDGRGDVVALYDLGAAGTKLIQFRSNGTGLRLGPKATDPTLAWAVAIPY